MVWTLGVGAHPPRQPARDVGRASRSLLQPPAVAAGFRLHIVGHRWCRGDPARPAFSCDRSGSGRHQADHDDARDGPGDGDRAQADACRQAAGCGIGPPRHPLPYNEDSLLRTTKRRWWSRIRGRDGNLWHGRAVMNAWLRLRPVRPVQMKGCRMELNAP